MIILKVMFGLARGDPPHFFMVTVNGRNAGAQEKYENRIKVSFWAESGRPGKPPQVLLCGPSRRRLLPSCGLRIQGQTSG